MTGCRLREFSNRTRLDKNKTGGEPSEREMKCDNEATNSNTERKKQEVTSKMAYLEVKKWRECILRVEYWKYRKNGSVSVVGSAICRPRASSHMQISVCQEPV